MRKEIFLAIANQLKAAVPELKHIDLWNEQLASVQSEKAWAVPSCFIEFEQYEVRQLANKVYMADVPVRLHIITRATPARGVNDTAHFEASLAYFDLIDKVHAAMVSFHSDTCSTFQLTTSATNHNHNELIESIERYVTHASDYTAYRHSQAQLVEDINYRIDRIIP